MKFELDEAAAERQISGYQAGWIRVGELRIERPCLIHSEGIAEARVPASPEALEIRHFAPVVEINPGILLLGTGERQVFADYGITQHLAQAGIALEIMDTGAACRLYNVISSEGRSVAAMLYMI